VRGRAWPWLALAVATVGALLAAACLRPVDSASSASDQGISVASTADAVSFHPYKTSDTASSTYQGLVYGGSLLDRDPQHPEQFIGRFAASWTVSDDGLTYTFTLRPDLVWSDGQPLTADDFKWTYDQASNPANAWPYLSTIEPIASYDAPDERTVVVRLKEPLAVGLELANTITPLPRHVWEQLDWNDPARNPEIEAPTVGSGPFLLQEWVRDDHATFVPNDHYFKGRPRLERYTIRIAGTAQIAYQWLKAGEVDVSTFSPGDYADAKRQDNFTVYEWWPATGDWSYVGYNLRQPALQDVRVRRALAYAVDRQAIIDRLLYGLAEPIYSTFAPTCWCYDPDVPHRDYDLDRARALLDEAGYVPGADGIRARDGTRLALRLLYGPNTNRTRQLIATVLQASFHQIGVDVQITGLEWSAYLAALRTPPFAWDLNVGGWSATVDPHWMYQIWSAEGIPDLNAGAYQNPTVEALFEQGAHELDQAKRKPIYDEIQRILAEDQPYIFLYANKAYEGVNNRLGGIVPSPLGLDWNLEQWYVRP